MTSKVGYFPGAEHAQLMPSKVSLAAKHDNQDSAFTIWKEPAMQGSRCRSTNLPMSLTR